MAKSEYNEEIQNTADVYVNEWFNETRIDQDVIPSVARLSFELGVSRKTLYNWGNEYPDFLHTLEKLQSLQEILLLNKGLKGEFNSNIAKLALANHGYMDRVANEVNLNDETKEKADKLIKDYLGNAKAGRK